jgi:hypothetical protein
LDDPAAAFDGLDRALAKALGSSVSMQVKSTHAVLDIPAGTTKTVRAILAEMDNATPVMSRGDSPEIYNEVGLPKDVAEQFSIFQMSGTHGIGHTRMATGPAVTTMGAHPFNTSDDQCLVHNGFLSSLALKTPVSGNQSPQQCISGAMIRLRPLPKRPPKDADYRLARNPPERNEQDALCAGGEYQPDNVGNFEPERSPCYHVWFGRPY